MRWRTETSAFPSSVIRERLRDYQSRSPTEERRELVQLWREHHPDAANEVSGAFHPVVKDMTWEKRAPDEPDEQWFSDVYFVTVRKHESDAVFGSRGGMVQLGIASLDGTARHDWREFQAIKNQLAGPECEAFELYPAESRLIDPSNYYTLWCFPGLRRLKVGMNIRRVMDADEALAPQRAFGKGAEVGPRKEEDADAAGVSG